MIFISAILDFMHNLILLVFRPTRNAAGGEQWTALVDDLVKHFVGLKVNKTTHR